MTRGVLLAMLAALAVPAAAGAAIRPTDGVTHGLGTQISGRCSDQQGAGPALGEPPDGTTYTETDRYEMLYLDGELVDGYQPVEVGSADIGGVAWGITQCEPDKAIRLEERGAYELRLVEDVLRFEYQGAWAETSRDSTTVSVIRFTVAGCGDADLTIERAWTRSGADAGLAGTRTFNGQRITATEPTEYTFADGSTLRLGAGATVRLTCDKPRTPFDWHVIAGRIWSKISGGGAEPTFGTDRAVLGVRGTAFSLAYDARHRRTSVAVTQGRVTLRNRKGAVRRTIVIRAGRRAIQEANRPPRLIG